MKKITKFAHENPKAGGFPLPVGCQIPISNLILTFQNRIEIASLIWSLGFRFSYSFKGFRSSLCQSLFDNTKLRNYFELHKLISKYLTKKCNKFFSLFCVRTLSLAERRVAI